MDKIVDEITSDAIDVDMDGGREISVREFVDEFAVESTCNAIGVDVDESTET